MKTKTELLTDDKLNAACALITNHLADAFDLFEDKSQVDVSKLAEKVYNDNLTNTLSILIGLNKEYSKEEIKYFLQHMSESLCALGLILAKTAELDY